MATFGSQNIYKDTHDIPIIPSILLLMKLTLSSVFLLLAAVVSAADVHTARQQCPEAARFGEVSITPSNVSPGDVRAFSLPTCRLKC